MAVENLQGLKAVWIMFVIVRRIINLVEDIASSKVFDLAVYLKQESSAWPHDPS